MPLEKKQLTNTLSVLVYCPEDKTFLLLLNEERGDYWIPFTEMNENLSWKDNLQCFRKELIDFDIKSEKLLKIYKIWTLKKELLHLLFQISIPKDIKANCKTNTCIGVVGWYSCRELVNIRPLLRSLEILEIIQIYKPIVPNNTQGVHQEPIPLGTLTEIRKTDLLVDDKNCENACYLDLLDSAGLSTPAQYDIYEEYIMHTYPCIYMSYISFANAMEPYDLSENIMKLFQAADIWRRNYLTFQDFLFLFAVMNPYTAHYGHLAEIRCQYIFRYYNENQDGKLNYFEFKNLITDLKLKNNPEISEKELDKLFECQTRSLNFKTNSYLTFDQFFNYVLECKIQDTSVLLRFKEDSCTTPRSDFSDSTERFGPCQFLLPFRSNGPCAPDEIPKYSIVLKTTILKQKDSPFVLRDMRLLEDAMTKSVSEEFQILSNPEFQESLDLEEKTNDLLSALKYFSTEINGAEFCTGEFETKDKAAYSWGTSNVDKLAITFIVVCEEVKRILSREPRLLEIQPPVYVMGDLHGNFHDLMCFEKTLWRNGVALTPTKMLFLGDYVDRGVNGVEVMMYLFSNKIQNPDKFFLIRGNHEIREIQKLFTFQKYSTKLIYRECSNTFGETMGMAVWKAVNEAFDVMPLAAIIDNKVFCCHGGIPPPWLCPVVSVINSIPNPLVNCERQSPLAWALMWNDPLKSRFSRNSIQQLELITNEGFVPNLQRGTGFCFSCCALDKFLLTNGLTHVIRAHEVVRAGFQIHQKGKLLTVFSSSNYCGGKNYAGTILVADNLLRVCMVDTVRKK